MENYADECTITFLFMSFFSIAIGIIGLSILFPLGIFTSFFQNLLQQLKIPELFFIAGIFWLVGLVFINFYANVYLPYRLMGIGKYLIFDAILLLFSSNWMFPDNFLVFVMWNIYFLLFSVMGIVILPFIPFFVIGSHSMKQTPQNPPTLNEKNSDHDAIIVVDYLTQLKFPIYGGGIDILINDFKDSRPFKVYQISSPEEFRNIVLNPHAKSLWIFGHGARDRLSFGAGIEQKYDELKNAPKKQFIAQLHCNNCMELNCSSSLADFLAEQACVSNDYRKLIFYRRDTRSCLKKYKNLVFSSSKKRICEIFNDLKNDREMDKTIINLIDKNRKIVATENALNFQGDRLKKQIKYNPKFFHNHLSQSSDNVIRFILLHEEAHLAKGKNYLLIIFGLLVTISATSLWIMYSPISALVKIFDNNFTVSNFLLGILFLFISLMIVIPGVWRLLYDSMYDEEINSDLYGAKCLVTFFDERDPACIARDALMWNYSESEAKQMDLLIIILKILGTYPDCHPPVCVRVKKIRENFPNLYH